MVLPHGVLRAAVNGPVLVELKNGDSYSGTLAAIDHLMNLKLEDAVFTARSEYRFEKLQECMIRGQFVKFIRFPDEIIEKCVVQEMAGAGDGSRKGRRERGRGKGGKGSRQPEASSTSAPRVMKVPSNLIGMIIGKGGENIRRFSMDSGAQIEVEKEQVDDSDERNIYLRGSPECVEQAFDMISAYVREKATYKTPASRPKQRAPNQQNERIQMPFPHDLSGFLLHPQEKGKGGKDAGKGQPSGILLERLNL